MKKLIGLLAVAGLITGNAVQAQGDIENGRMLSTQCTACHGTDGMSLSEQFPNIAGQKESYLAAQLNKYKAGDRKDPMMSAIVGPINPQDILDLAAYYASNSAVASFSFETQMLSIPYVDVGGTTYGVEMSLDDINNLVFSVKSLDEL